MSVIQIVSDSWKASVVHIESHSRKEIDRVMNTDYNHFPHEPGARQCIQPSF